KPYFPREATAAYLLVDAMNSLRGVSDKGFHREYVKRHVKKADKAELARTIRSYAGPTARNFFAQLLGE
ncbi:MAG: hypothetical protein KGQ70_03690, partial [Alphaproteobacteria bacterium]|nr:hypothetical protein [Alphaproteobacteria bacterium]